MKLFRFPMLELALRVTILSLPAASSSSEADAGVAPNSLPFARAFPAEKCVHQELLLNSFGARGEISSGAVEGLNNQIRVATRQSYGFCTYDTMDIALVSHVSLAT